MGLTIACAVLDAVSGVRGLVSAVAGVAVVDIAVRDWIWSEKAPGIEILQMELMVIQNTGRRGRNHPQILARLSKKSAEVQPAMSAEVHWLSSAQGHGWLD